MHASGSDSGVLGLHFGIDGCVVGLPLRRKRLNLLVRWDMLTLVNSRDAGEHWRRWRTLETLVNTGDDGETLETVQEGSRPTEFL